MRLLLFFSFAVMTTTYAKLHVSPLTRVAASQQIRWSDVDECPHYWSKVIDDQGKAVIDTSQVRTLDVPEYNDCQKLITDVRKSQNKSPVSVYGPLAAIFVSDQLKDLEVKLGFNRGVVGPTNAILHPSDDKDNFYHALFVLNVSPGRPYTQLGISAGLSTYCVFMYSAGRKWEAQMTPTKNKCPVSLTRRQLLDAHATRLTVQYLRYGYSEDKYPSVARWHWNGSTQAMGTKCGAAWCVLSLTPLGSLTPPTTPGSTWISKIPGWYDEQQLAEVGADGSLVLNGTWGTVVPDQQLDHRTVAEFRSGWVVASRVLINTNRYLAKLNLTPATNLNGPVNIISLRMRIGSAATSYPYLCGNPVMINPSAKDTIWEARIQSAAGNCAIFRVYREPHGTAPQYHAGTKVDVLGTARWRWVKDDEKVWMECDNGCCQVGR